MRSKITIPNPCSKKWDELSGETTKRFCGACSKHVYDFTKMETEEIIQFLKTGKEGVCGVFTKTQVYQMSFKEKVLFFVKEHKNNPVRLSSVLATIIGLAIVNFFSSCIQKTMGEIVPVGTECVDGLAASVSPTDTLPKCDSSKAHFLEIGEIEIIMGDTVAFDTTKRVEIFMGKLHVPTPSHKED